jgi:hypothetical protein
LDTPTNINKNNNMENLSKKKQGRPQSDRRKAAEEICRDTMPNACTRTLVDELYFSQMIVEIKEGDQDIERDIFGNAYGKSCPPKGLKTAAVQACRWVESVGETDDAFTSAIKTMAEARRDGIPFGTIARHFKKLRLGEREGTTKGAYRKFCTAIDDYRKSFPKTSDETLVNALRILLAQLTDDEGGR